MINKQSTKKCVKNRTIYFNTIESRAEATKNKRERLETCYFQRQKAIDFEYISLITLSLVT